MKRKRLSLLGGLFVTVTMCSMQLFAADMSKGSVLETTQAYTAADTSVRVCYVFEGEELSIVDETEEFYGVLLEEDEVVYIEKEYLAVEKQEPVQDVTQAPVKEEVTKAPVVVKEEKKEEKKVSKGEQVVAYAKQFIGTPYVSGGNSLTKGVDCSGFTQQVYLNFGVKLQRSSHSQYVSNGKKVTKDQLKPGDLVFYGYNGRVNHVAIYIGNGQIIHSPVPGKSVSIAPLWQRGDAPIMGYKRIVN